MRRLWFLALALPLALAACGGSSGGAAAPAAGSAPATIRVAYQADADAPLFLAESKGLFAKYGLKADMVKFEAGPPMFAALKNGSVDVAAEGSGPLVVGPARGIPQIGFMIAHDDSGVSGLVVHKGSGIHSVADLKGKIVAAQKDSGTYFALVQALGKAGLSLSDIHYKDLHPQAMLPAFQNHDVDAAWVWAPWVQKMAQMNGRIVTTNLQQGIFQPVVWAANTTWAGKHPDVLQRFIRVTDAAAKYATAHPNQAAAALVPVMQVTAAVAKTIVEHDGFPTAAQQLSAGYPTSFVKGYAGCDGGFALSVANIGKQLVALGQLKSLPPCHQVYTPKYLQAFAGAGAK